MSLMDYFRKARKPNSASLAKERLQIIISHERTQNKGPDYLPMLKNELVEVISKYVEIDKEQVKVGLERTDDCSILELNITLPEAVAA